MLNDIVCKRTQYNRCVGLGCFMNIDIKEDRRVRKTKKALRESLAELLAEKSIQYISVRELTDKADVHRSTFYANLFPSQRHKTLNPTFARYSSYGNYRQTRLKADVTWAVLHQAHDIL